MTVATRLALLILAGLTSACAGQYRLVATEDVAAIEQCAVVSSDSYRQLLAQQRELSDGLTQLQSDLDASRERIQARLPEPAECPDVPMVATGEQSAGIPDQVAKQLVGTRETLSFDDLKLALVAEMDTGTTQSVLRVSQLQPFERNGEDWVRFTLSGEGEHTFERRQIRQSGDSERPVVQLRYSLGRVSQRSDFTLISRPHSAAPVTLGRLALRDVMVVDVSGEFIASSPVETP